MGASVQGLGLRERKKIQTKETIQREAYRLFDQHGYANTTVEQIAEAAEVSPSTFFRYFPSKELVLMADDLDRVTIEALAQQPADLSPIQAFRRAFDITMKVVSKDGWELERTRQRLVFSIPELKAAQFDAYGRIIRLLSEAECQRTGRDGDDFEVRVFFGVLAGALMAVIDHSPGAVHLLYRALDFIEAGMPL
ncbi:TetR family transcriptional regulator [Mycobacterium sp.]|uniref:TetR family transcriptional regulator n=1 Tax=Mycobacterium sp. TaxID=1785 RepID=UPI002C5B72B5|nr:TetR family transcriptional regulator [Mycobacterium sp.]HKP41169.1 TetR family transcriptional regulator [Mycobacterium sp.]